MLVRRLPTFALLASLPLLLAHCGSDSSGTPNNSAGAPSSSAGSSGSPAAAGQPSAGALRAGRGPCLAAAARAWRALAARASPAVAAAGRARGGGGNIAGGNSAGAVGTAGSGTGGGSTSGFALTSPDHAEGAKFAKDYTCDAMNGTFGSGVNPELDWSGAPSSTMSYAITFIDTTLGDTNQLGQHWAIWNIPATVMKFPKATGMTLSGDLAAAKQTGKFLTPCAQSVMNGMDDQYEFTVWAIPTATLNVSGTNPTVAQVLTALKALSPKPPTATLHGHAGLKGK